MIDQEVVDEHLADLKATVRELRKMASRYTRPDLDNDMEKRWAVLHGLQTAVQNILDTGGHLLSGIGRNDYDDYTAIIDLMAQEAILTIEFAQSIRGMAGLRNVLVHRYMAVDADRIWELPQRRLDDFDLFCEQVLRYVEGRRELAGE